ncbi:MAG TPA: hypothetical protein PKY12_04635, partial [Catalimonadaceae bacterium]|nr:hypothetical protein [Catalimonadaceae bacterium]
MKSILLKSDEKDPSQVSLNSAFLSVVSQKFDTIRGLFRSINLNNMGYIPRWCVLTVDVALVMVAAITTFLFLKSMGRNAELRD